MIPNYLNTLIFVIIFNVNRLNLVNCAPSVAEKNVTINESPTINYQLVPLEVYQEWIYEALKVNQLGSLCMTKIVEQIKFCWEENRSTKETMESYCSSNCDIINCVENKVERFCTSHAARIFKQQRDDFYSTAISATVKVNNEMKCPGEYEICLESSFFGSALGIGVTITVITGIIAITCLIGAFIGYRYRMRRAG